MGSKPVAVLLYKLTLFELNLNIFVVFDFDFLMENIGALALMIANLRNDRELEEEDDFADHHYHSPTSWDRTWPTPHFQIFSVDLLAVSSSQALKPFYPNPVLFFKTIFQSVLYIN